LRASAIPIDAPTPVEPPTPAASEADTTVEKTCALFEALILTSPSTSALPRANSATVLDLIWLKASAPAPLTATPVVPPIATPKAAAAEIALIELRLTSSVGFSSVPARRRT
jgi:hypothetical protein